MSSIHLLSSFPIGVTMCMYLCGRKWGNVDHYSRSYQLALFLPLQSFCLPILEVWSPCLSLRLHSFSSCPQKYRTSVRVWRKNPLRGLSIKQKLQVADSERNFLWGRICFQDLLVSFFLGQTEFLKQTTGLQVGRAPLNCHPLRCEGWTLCCFSMLFYVDVVFYFSRLREGKKCERLKEKNTCGRERGEKNILGTWKECFLCLYKLPVHGSYLYLVLWSTNDILHLTLF